MSSSRNIFLFLTDKESDAVCSAYDELRAAVSRIGTARLLFHKKERTLSPKLAAREAFVFTNECLMELNYIPIARSIIPGSNHFPVLKFYLKHPGADYYWFVEDDVRFNGQWADFFHFFEAYDHDFISCHLRYYKEEPGWFWWKTLHHPDRNIPLNDRIRSFNPIYRISGRALSFIHQALTDFWIGHHEVLLPTLLHQHGYSIMDFGGEGNFVLSSQENRFYTSGIPDHDGNLVNGTMRYRPVWTSIGQEINKLYHPIKE